MKQVYSLYECSDRATRMIPQSQFPILALPTDARFNYTKIVLKLGSHSQFEFAAPSIRLVEEFFYTEQTHSMNYSTRLVT